MNESLESWVEKGGYNTNSNMSQLSQHTCTNSLFNVIELLSPWNNITHNTENIFIFNLWKGAFVSENTDQNFRLKINQIFFQGQEENLYSEAFQPVVEHFQGENL